MLGVDVVGLLAESRHDRAAGIGPIDEMPYQEATLQGDRLTEAVAVVESCAVVRSPLRHIDAEAVGASARPETRNREVFLPPVSAFRWWARRTEAINGAVLDAIARDQPGRLLVVDPFAGGGVIPLVATMRKHWTYAQDLNPWAATGLAGMLDLPNAGDLAKR